MKSQQVKNSFQSGVLSPRLSIRDDIAQFATALEACTNWIVTPQGGIVMHEGAQNMAPASVITEQNRIFQFHKGGNESDMLIEVSAGNGLIQFRVDGQALPDTVSHDYTLDQLEDLYFTNSEVTGVLLHPDHPPLYIEIDLEGNVTGDYLPSDTIPYVDFKDSDSPSVAQSNTDTYTLVFKPGEDGNAWDSRDWIMRYDGVWVTGNQGNVKSYRFKDATKNIERLTDALNRLASLKNTSINVTSSAIDTYQIILTGENAGKVLNIQPENPAAQRFVDIESTIDESDTDEPLWSYPTYVLYNGNYYQCIKPNSPQLGVNDPSFTEYWTDLGTTKPDTFDWQYPDGNTWQAFDPTGTGFTESYGPGGRGFPTVAVIHEQRTILLGSPAYTAGMAGSRLNQYKDFVRGPEDDDPFFFALDTSDTPTIKWAVSNYELVIGTSSGDYNISAEVTLSPSDVQAYKQNNARSDKAKAISINTDILYIEQGKEKVRATSYMDSKKKWSSTDISLIAEHLLDSRAKRIVLMQTPEVVAFVLREDGSLVGISYSHEQQSMSWYEFETQGVITDIAVCYTSSTGHTPPAYDPTDRFNTMNTDEDELWMTVTYNGTDYYIEKMPYPKRVFKAAESEDDFIVNGGKGFLVDQHLVCLDGWIRGTIDLADNNVISGLEQFEDLTVACMVEDAWTGEYEVKDGKILLEAAEIAETFSGTYAVGLRYTATAKTFEMASGNPNGTALGTMRRWNKLFVKIYNSALPIINGTLPPDRNPATPMGLAEIIQDGLQERSIRNVGWNDGAITIVQDRPYPTECLGFYGQYSTNNS